MKKLLVLSVVVGIWFVPVFSQSIYTLNGQSIFKGLFKQPIEMLYIIFWDGKIYGFTTYHEDGVKMSYGLFKEVLRKKGQRIKNVAIVIHNHLPEYGLNFSQNDFKFLRHMRQDGFVGSFCLWSPTGKVKYLMDKNVALKQFLKEKETKKFLKKFKKEYPRAYKELKEFLTKRGKNG